MAERFNEKDKKLIFNSLKKNAKPNSITSLVEIEGVLVGSLCRAEHVGMQKILNIIWGEDKDNHPDWASQKDAEEFFDSLYALQNKNNISLQSTYYKPQLLKEKKYYKRWCSGFIKGFGGLDAVGPLSEYLSNPVLFSAMFILILAEGADLAPGILDVDNRQKFSSEARESSIIKFGSKIKTLYEYYHDQEDPTHVHGAHCNH